MKETKRFRHRVRRDARSRHTCRSCVLLCTAQCETKFKKINLVKTTAYALHVGTWHIARLNTEQVIGTHLMKYHRASLARDPKVRRRKLTAHRTFGRVSNEYFFYRGTATIGSPGNKSFRTHMHYAT